MNQKKTIGLSKEMKNSLSSAAFKNMNSLNDIYSNINSLSIAEIFIVRNNNSEETSNFLKSKNLEFDFSTIIDSINFLVITYKMDNKMLPNLLSICGSRGSFFTYYSKFITDNISVYIGDSCNFKNIISCGNRNYFNVGVGGIKISHQYNSYLESIIDNTAKRLTSDIKKNFSLVPINFKKILDFQDFFDSLSSEMYSQNLNFLDLTSTFQEKLDLWYINNDISLSDIIPLSERKSINKISLKI